MCGDSELTADKDELLSVSSGVPHILPSQVLLCLQLHLQIKREHSTSYSVTACVLRQVLQRHTCAVEALDDV